jgi:hypothetical protein
MKWLRLFLLLGALGFGSCSNPMVPKYPDPDSETDPKDPDPGPEKGGFLFDGSPIYWL